MTLPTTTPTTAAPTTAAPTTSARTGAEDAQADPAQAGPEADRPTPADDPLATEIAWERTHLAESRAALARMRARAQHLFSTGDTVAATRTARETLGRTLSRRVKELADDRVHPTLLRPAQLRREPIT
jgi:hypothetical protein